MKMNRLTAIPILALTLILAGCSPIEQQARNTAAALQGTIVAAQAKYQSSCTANPAQAVCVDINKAVSGEAALITSIEAYCNWSTTMPPSDPNATCTPVKSAQAGLQTAIANATNFINSLKGVL